MQHNHGELSTSATICIDEQGHDGIADRNNHIKVAKASHVTDVAKRSWQGRRPGMMNLHMERCAGYMMSAGVGCNGTNDDP